MNLLWCQPRRITKARRSRNRSRTSAAGPCFPSPSISRARWCTKCAQPRQRCTSGWSPRFTMRSGASMVPQHQQWTLPSSGRSMEVTGRRSCAQCECTDDCEQLTASRAPASVPGDSPITAGAGVPVRATTVGRLIPGAHLPGSTAVCGGRSAGWGSGKPRAVS